MESQDTVGRISQVYSDKIVIEVGQEEQYSDLYQSDGINTFITIFQTPHKKFIYQVTGIYGRKSPILSNGEVQRVTYFEAIPVGEISRDRFTYGLSHFPMMNHDTYITSERDIEIILQLSSDSLSLNLGKMASHNNYSPKIALDRLLPYHTGILGNTGSGKSTTIRKLLYEITELASEQHIDPSNMNFFVFDVHNEYTNFREEYVDNIDLQDLAIPLDTLDMEDWINLIRPDENVQLPLLRQALRMANVLNNTGDRERANSCIRAYAALQLYENVHTEVIGKRAKVIGLLQGLEIDGMDSVMSRYNSVGSFNEIEIYEPLFKRLIKKFIMKQSGHSYTEFQKMLHEQLEEADYAVTNLDNLVLGLDIILLFEEIKGNHTIRTHCSTLFTRIQDLISTYSTTLFDPSEKKRETFDYVLRHKKAITVMNCVQMEDADLLFFTSYILRRFHNKQRDNRNFSKDPELLHFIFDEAHKYIYDKENDTRNTHSLKIFETIAKEGRKFGISMILASQRPGELSQTVLSQCNNFILHRIRNNTDLDQMRHSIPYINDSQLFRLTFMQTGSALFVGEAFPIPMELKIDGEGHGDTSKPLLPSIIWNKEKNL